MVELINVLFIPIAGRKRKPFRKFFWQDTRNVIFGVQHPDLVHNPLGLLEPIFLLSPSHPGKGIVGKRTDLIGQIDEFLIPHDFNHFDLFLRSVILYTVTILLRADFAEGFISFNSLRFSQFIISPGFRSSRLTYFCFLNGGHGGGLDFWVFFLHMSVESSIGTIGFETLIERANKVFGNVFVFPAINFGKSSFRFLVVR